jgi:formylglycine-generating enzyme required for sulfatase activity
LLAASGYAGRPKDFEDLLRILDGEVRLITPTDPEGREGEAPAEPGPEGSAGASPSPADRRHYQLTHDYLVPSLREWLTRKQRETRRGRAQLRLAERAAQWAARPERRFLPTGWEWLNIRLFTRPRDWTAPQRQMMRKAGKDHMLRGLALLAALLLLAATGYEVYGRMHAQSLVEAIVNADASNVRSLAQQLRGYRRWATPHLRHYLEDYPDDSKEHLRASLALLPRDKEQAGYLYQQMLEAPPPELRAIRDELLPRHTGLKDDLWAVLLEERPDPQHQARRFRAACALAAEEPDEANSQRWRDLAPFLVDRLLDAVEENPSHYLVLREMLRPLRRRLHGPLYKVFTDEERRRQQPERSFAASLLADYADRPEEVIELALAAEENQLDVLAPRLAAYKERTLLACKDALTRPPDDARKSEKEKEDLARRKANAGVILLRFRQAEGVWDLLRHGRDPRVRGHLIHRLSRLGVDPRLLVERLEQEKEVSIRMALLLGLGDFTHPPRQGQPGWPLPAERERLLPLVWRLYGNEDAGLHGAAEWLLRKWEQQDRLAEAEKKQAAAWRPRLEQVRKQPATGGAGRRPVWYVNRQGQTMVVFSGPSEFWMGSPDDEPDKIPRLETQHRVLIPRTFALAAKEVTIEQFLRWKCHHPPDFFSRTLDSPVIRISWYEAAEYCNWLSEQEKIPGDQWCYPKECKPGMTLPKDYLSRTGYRLPTGAEWEYACRAGSLTSRFYGGSEELLGDYAWYSVTAAGKRVYPVGQLKPNPWGLFDIYGNVAEWCQERFTIPYLPVEPGRTRKDVEDPAWTSGEEMHGVVVRGDSVFSAPSFVRSSHRDNWQPGTQHVFLGLRPARTLR